MRIKNLVKTNGDKFIVVEDGEPQMVVMSFPEYEKLVTHEVKEGIAAEQAKSQESGAPRNDFLEDFDSFGLEYGKDAGIGFGPPVGRLADGGGESAAIMPISLDEYRSASTPPETTDDIPPLFERGLGIEEAGREDQKMFDQPKEVPVGSRPLHLEDIRLEDLPI